MVSPEEAMENLTIDRAHDGFINDEFTTRQLVEYYLHRIRSLNGPLPLAHNTPGLPNVAGQPDVYLNAIISVSDTALDEADELDEYLFRFNRWKGLLHGIPVIVKDSITTAGLRTTFGSSRAANYVPDQDATVIQNLKKQGAIIIAKSTLPGGHLPLLVFHCHLLIKLFLDWSASIFCTSSLSGTTRNPHDLGREPSSGTAAAIAADLAILGLDTDTDGTIGLSASSCSLVGLRPRPGMVSRHGTAPLILPQDSLGPICRTVRDAALMYGAMIGFDPQDALTAYSTVVPTNNRNPTEYFTTGLGSAHASSLRIGVVNSLFGDNKDPDQYSVNQLVTTALDHLGSAGASLVPITIPHLQQWLITTQLHIYRSQSDLNKFFTKAEPPLNHTVASLYKENTHHPAQDLFERIAKGPHPDHDLAYHICLEKHAEFRPLVMSKMREQNIDLLAFPTSKVPAPFTADVLAGKWNSRNFPTNTSLATQTQLPSISIPVGQTEDGVPVGITLVASMLDEKRLLEAAAAVEDEVDGRIIPRFP
ncbi:hypothetical protein DV738_g3431, partial [Chaetothyriales sp. CBS 135597]